MERGQGENKQHQSSSSASSSTAPLPTEGCQRTTRQLRVFNTFLDVQDADFEAQMGRSIHGSSNGSSERAQSGSQVGTSESGSSSSAHSGSSSERATGSQGSPSLSPIPTQVASPSCMKTGASGASEMAASSQAKREVQNGSALPGQFVPDGLEQNAGYSAVDHSSWASSSSSSQGEVDQGVASNRLKQNTDHANGKCKPCIFWSQGACTNGEKCFFCHLEHPYRKKSAARPSTKKLESRARYLAEHMSTQNPSSSTAKQIVQL